MMDRMRFAAAVAGMCAVVGATLACATQQSAAGPVRSSAAAAEQRHLDSLELLRLHEGARRAHLDKRADQLVAAWSDDFVSVGRGGVTPGNRERGLATFQAYLDASTFQAWDDIVPPRIRISRDGQMAFVVVQKRVHLTSRTPAGAIESERTRFAWLSVYEKRDDRWQMVAIASTDRPDA